MENNDYDNFYIINAILNIILGLIIGIIFGYYFLNQNVLKGPDSNIISKQIQIDSDGRKFKWVPKVCICPLNYSMDKLKTPEKIDLEH